MNEHILPLNPIGKTLILTTMATIKVNKDLKEITTPIYAYEPTGASIGIIYNSVQLADLQVQIAKERAEGYYITETIKKAHVL